jgi:hypothetical protein
MLDEDLAELYGVETKRLVQQVKRNLKRFPEDFMFQLDKYSVIEERLEQIERGIDEHDEQFAQIYSALRQLINPPPPNRSDRSASGSGRTARNVAHRQQRFEVTNCDFKMSSRAHLRPICCPHRLRGRNRR